MAISSQKHEEQSTAWKEDNNSKWEKTGYGFSLYQGNITTDPTAEMLYPFLPMIDKFSDQNEKTKEKICMLLKENPNLDEVDIADRLNIGLKSVSEICDELLNEGKIKRNVYEQSK